MPKKLLIALLFLIGLSGCTYTDEEGKQQTLDLNFNHHVQFQRTPEDPQSSEIVEDPQSSEMVKNANPDDCSVPIAPGTLVLLHGKEIGSDVNARPLPDKSQWYDPPIMAKVGDSVRVLAKEEDWYQSRWVTPNNNVLVSYFHCSVILEPTK